MGTLLDAGMPNEALAYCRELLKDDDNSYTAHHLEARCEINLKWYREAKSSLETAAKLELSNEDVKTDLNYVSGRLCENSFFDHPIHRLVSSKFVMSKI